MHGHRNNRRFWLGATALVVAASLAPLACAGHGGGYESGASRPDAAAATTDGRRSLLSFEDFMRFGLSQGTTLLDAVRRLRPEFLKARNVASGTIRRQHAEVYIERMRAGGLDVLRTIPIGHVESVRYISPMDALIRYGSLRNHQGGVIMVTLREP